MRKQAVVRRRRTNELISESAYDKSSARQAGGCKAIDYYNSAEGGIGNTVMAVV